MTDRMTSEEYREMMGGKKPERKYHNTITGYKGVKYHSKLEADYARKLDLRLRAKDIRGWERQINIQLTAYGKNICKYRIDFVVYYFNTDVVEYVECKGMATPAWKIKWALLNAQMDSNPDVRLKLVTCS